MVDVTSRKAMGVLFGGAIGVTLLVQVYLWQHIADDAFITFRYAERLVAGFGLTFNDGERVEGFSNPSWTVLLAVLKFVTSISVPDVARGLGLLSSVLTLYVVVAIVRSLDKGISIHVLSVALMLIVASPGFHVYATAGLEGPLLGLLLVVAVLQTLKGDTHGAATALGLAAITRPEGLLYGLLWLFTIGNRRKSLVGLIRGRSLDIALIVFLPAMWLIFRLWYFESWLPNAAIAKPPGTFGGLVILPSYVQPWIIALGGPMILLPWFLLHPTRNPSQVKIMSASLGLLIAADIFLLYARGDWMPFGRFVVPVWPLVAAGFAVWFVPAFLEMRVRGFFRYARWVAPVMYFALFSCSVFAWQVQVRRYVANNEMYMLMRGTDQLTVGAWLSGSVKEGSTVAIARLGGIAYAAPRLFVWDLNGLTDKEEALFVADGRPGGVNADPVLSRKPDVLALVDVPVEWGYKSDSELMDWIKRRYTLTRSFPQGNYGAVDVWVADDRIESILRKDMYREGG